MQIASVTLQFTKATKHTYRFDSDDPDAFVRTIYVDRQAFAECRSAPPPTVTVTVSAPKDADTLND